MRSFVRLIMMFILIGILAAMPATTHAQFGSLKKKAESKLKRKADQKVDKAMDDAIDEAEDAAEDAATGDGDAPVKSEKKTPESDASGESNAEGESAAASGSSAGTKESAAAKLKPGEGAWANYDFIPGDRVLYYEDLEHTPVGDFPQRLGFEKGNMETVEWEGSKYLRIRSNCDLHVPLPEVLPEMFTFEFDLYLPGGRLEIYCPSGEKGRSHTKHSYIELHKNLVKIRGSGGGESEMQLDRDLWGQVWHFRIMGNKKYLKLYVNELRVGNVPNADFVRGNKIHFYLYNPGSDEILMDNFRVAEGGKKILYDALLANGRVATQGIYFDSGSDKLRPESTPTLKEMGQMLQEHTDLRLLIEGHTDDQGDEAYNQDLSQKRAASVRAYLVSEYGIDGSRLESKGFGESKPVSPNTTAEGRQNNRRVELVRL